MDDIMNSKLIVRVIFFLVALAACTAVGPAVRAKGTQRWSAAAAWKWYHRQSWLAGCNYIPSNADNTLEMWQGATFSPAIIHRELGFAHRLGFNVIRVFLHYLVWNHNPAAMKQRMRTFLKIASHEHIRVIFVLFDDCWKPVAHLGPQPQPIPGVHNSQWVQCPGPAMISDRKQWPELKAYEQGVIRAFGKDKRVLCWDIYNEAGNSGNGLKTLPLLKQTFRWARACQPRQPLTACIWQGPKDAIRTFVLSHSDVITFHNYSGPHNLQREITRLKRLHRPLICTEYMRRPVSTFAKCMPVFKRNDVGCLNWGLTNGRTQTIYPWGSKPGTPPPALWFHNILHRDGSPFSVREVHLIERLTGAAMWPSEKQKKPT